jgi:hypothetical protein
MNRAIMLQINGIVNQIVHFLCVYYDFFFQIKFIMASTQNHKTTLKNFTIFVH